MPNKIKPHKKQVRKPDTRPNATKRGYGPEWKLISKSYKERHPICELCGVNPSKETHHIIPLKKGGTNDDSNLMALCLSCHGRTKYK